MDKRVTVIDYGRSNLLSVKRALEHCGAQVSFACAPEQIQSAQRLILPGVGAFADGMQQLKEKQLLQPIIEAAKNGVPLLGICLGMQLLFESSEENGLHAGIGLMQGKVTAIPKTDLQGCPQKVPHVGWGKLIPTQPDFAGSFLQGLPPQAECYFVHSFHACPVQPAHQVAYTLYGGHSICAAVQSGNLIGTQFHPEKSGEIGLCILRAFCNMESIG